MQNWGREKLYGVVRCRESWCRNIRCGNSLCGDVQTRQRAINGFRDILSMRVCRLQQSWLAEDGFDRLWAMNDFMNTKVVASKRMWVPVLGHIFYDLEEEDWGRGYW